MSFSRLGIQRVWAQQLANLRRLQGSLEGREGLAPQRRPVSAPDARTEAQKRREIGDWLVEASRFRRTGLRPPVERPAGPKEPFRAPPFRIPPLSSIDTVLVDPSTRQRASIHGSGSFVHDARELKRISELKRIPASIDNVELSLTREGRHVLLQPGTRACVLTVGAMMLLDQGRRPDWKQVAGSNLETQDDLRRFLERGGGKPITTALPRGPLPARISRLAELIEKQGPAALEVGGHLGGHQVLLDSVDLRENVAMLREPFHGWEIGIALDALNIGFTHEIVQLG